MRRAVAAIGCGLLGSVSVPPLGWWPAGIAAMGLFALVLSGQGLGHRLLLGWLFGIGLFGVTLFWMTEFHAVGGGLGIAIEALSFLIAAALVPQRDGLAPASVPVALIVAEWLRHRLPFGGIPMGGLDLGQVGGPFALVARVGGPFLVVGVAAAAGCALAFVARQRRHALPLAGAVVAITLLAAVAPAGGDSEKPLRVAVVQGGGVRGFRAVTDEAAAQASRVFEAQADASRRLAADDDYDLVVWPENGIDVDDIDGSREADVLTDLAKRLDATIIAGVTEEAKGDHFRNVAAAWDPDGAIVDRYVKEKRVPFGEYVPMRRLIERLVDLSILPRDAVSGLGPGVLDTRVGRLGVSISFETFFAVEARDSTRRGAVVLLVPTNAASFSTGQVPAQELAASRLRAIENGRWLIQSAPTGYGAVIDPSGNVLRRTDLGERQVLRAEVVPRTGLTLYARFGDAPVILMAAGVLMFASIRHARMGT